MNGDIASRRRFRARDLDGVVVGVSAAGLLAVWFFLARHADVRAYVRVVEDKEDAR